MEYWQTTITYIPRHAHVSHLLLALSVVGQYVQEIKENKEKIVGGHPQTYIFCKGFPQFIGRTTILSGRNIKLPKVEIQKKGSVKRSQHIFLRTVISQ